MKQNPKYSEMAKMPGFIGLPRRRKPKASKVTIKEHDLQVQAEELCLRLGLRFHRVPDIIYKLIFGFQGASISPHLKGIIAEFIRGVPDLMLFKRAANDNTVRFVEIKTEVGKLSKGQTDWHRGLNVHVTHGWDELQKAIIDFHLAPLEGK